MIADWTGIAGCPPCHAAASPSVATAGGGKLVTGTSLSGWAPRVVRAVQHRRAGGTHKATARGDVAVMRSVPDTVPTLRSAPDRAAWCIAEHQVAQTRCGAGCARFGGIRFAPKLYAEEAVFSVARRWSEMPSLCRKHGWTAPMGQPSRHALHRVICEIPGRCADVQDQLNGTGETGK